MPNNTPNLNALEHQIIAYLNERGPAYTLTISADLHKDPRVTQNTLWHLHDLQLIKWLGHTIYHQICSPPPT